MQEYLSVLDQVNRYGLLTPGRNGDTLELFGIAQRYSDIITHFPLPTTKYLPFNVIVAELLCFLRGYDDVRFFQKLGCNVWNANANSDYWKANPNYQPDYLGRIYGVQWRSWYKPQFDDNGKPNGAVTIDQIQQLIDGLKKDPHGRRHIVTAWNPGEIGEMCLPPCHMFFQCNVDVNNTMHLLMYQRSADMFLGVPFNIASYSLLLLILCKLTGYRPGSFIHMIGSAHIYEQHFDQVQTQLARIPGAPCTVEIIDRGQLTVNDFKVSDFVLNGYEPQDKIEAPMIV